MEEVRLDCAHSLRDLPMSLFDRLKTTPRWKHADAQVRLTAVQELDDTRDDTPEILATIASQDSDARVRRAAVNRLADPAALTQAARTDADEQVKEAAVDRLIALATHGGDDVSRERAEAALAGIDDQRQVGTVAKTAAFESVRLAAVDRVTEPRVLGSIARNATDPAVSLRAVERLADTGELTNIALRTEQKDAALAAFERVAAANPNDIETFRNAVAKAVSKSVQKRARALVQAWDEAEEARRAADDRLRQREVEICQRVEALAHAESWTESRAELDRAESEWAALGETAHQDLSERFRSGVAAARAAITAREEQAAEQARLERAREQALGMRRELVERVETIPPGDGMVEQLELARAEWDALPPVDGYADEMFALERRLNEVAARFRTLAQDRDASRAALASLEQLILTVEATAAAEDLMVARDRFGDLEKEWRVLSTAIASRPSAGIDDTALQERFRVAAAQIQQRLADRRQHEEKTQRDNLRRLERLAERLEKRTTAEDLSLKEADRGVKELRDAIDNPGVLPSREDRDHIAERLRAVQSKLVPRARELHEADDWKRFANATVQEQLCARTEALLQKINTAPDADLEAAAKELREINNRWREVAEAPRAQAQALWHRYRRAFDQVRARCQDFFAEQAAKRGENLQRKEALARRAEELAESTDWIRTADELRTLQAEWKSIGPVPRDQAKILWDRFRTACDRFFTRKQEDLKQRKEVWSANLARKDALCKRAEELADSSDWDAAAAELRRLQAEWKTIGAVRKNKGEALWNRFRAACDKFFERHKQRDQIAIGERVAAREALVADVEGLAAAPENAPDDLLQHVRTLRRQWDQSPPIPHDQLDPLQQRYTAAIERIVVSRPEKFRGSDIDPEANLERMEKLIARVEKLASDQPTAPTSSEALAAMLREALASNQIGGRPSEETRWRAAVEEVKQAQAAWRRIGPVPPESARALNDRFRAACDRIFDQHRRRAMATRS